MSVHLNLNSLERWMLIRFLRAADRHGNGQGAQEDVRRTAACLDALATDTWDAQMRLVRNAARAATRARAVAEVARDKSDPALAFVRPDALHAIGEAAIAGVIDDYDPAEDPAKYSFEKADVEYLSDELSRTVKEGQIQMARAREWKRVMAKIKTALDPHEGKPAGNGKAQGAVEDPAPAAVVVE